MFDPRICFTRRVLFYHFILVDMSQHTLMALLFFLYFLVCLFATTDKRLCLVIRLPPQPPHPLKLKNLESDENEKLSSTLLYAVLWIRMIISGS
jgi:hypothetical protein